MNRSAIYNPESGHCVQLCVQETQEMRQTQVPQLGNVIHALGSSKEIMRHVMWWSFIPAYKTDLLLCFGFCFPCFKRSHVEHVERADGCVFLSPVQF